MIRQTWLQARCASDVGSSEILLQGKYNPLAGGEGQWDSAGAPTPPGTAASATSPQPKRHWRCHRLRGLPHSCSPRVCRRKAQLNHDPH